MTSIRRVAVVGAGPAGATAAHRLRRAGADVWMFEANGAGEKPCGGGIPAAALERFPELGPSAPARRVVDRIVIHSPSDRVLQVGLSEGIHIFRRRELDGYLRERAIDSGARLVPTKVLGVRPLTRDQWELRTRDGAFGPFDLLVGADGVQGVVRRALLGPHVEGDLTLALYAYVPVVEDRIILKFYPDFNGYLWVFPRVDHVSIGICGVKTRVAADRLREALLEFIETHYPQGRLDGRGLKGYFIPASFRPLGRSPHVPSRGTWALVGDAAGFVDPMTREGIAPAMGSAVAMADRLHSHGRFATPPLPPALRWAHSHSKGFFRESFTESLVRLAAKSSTIRRVLADLFEGHQDYRKLKARLLMSALPCGLEVGISELWSAVRRLPRSRPHP